MSDSNGGGFGGLVSTVCAVIVGIFMLFAGCAWAAAIIAWPIWFLLLLNYTFGDPEMKADNFTNEEWRRKPAQRAVDIRKQWGYFGIYTLVLAIGSAVITYLLKSG